MSISRRKFLQNTAVSSAGLVLPALKDDASAYSVRPNQLLLDAKSMLKQDLYVGEDAELQLHIGYPSEITYVEDQTWGDFKDQYYWEQPLEEFLGTWQIAEADLNYEVPGYALDHWYGKDSSNALAYHLLRSLDLGEEVENGLTFNRYPTPASNYIAVHAKSKDAVNRLQKRLFELGLGVRVYYTNVAI